VGLLISSLAIISFSAVFYPDSLYQRPHPIFWRIILGIATSYLILLWFIAWLSL